MNTPETETPICKHCGEYEHDCKCAASREIANLMRELQEAKDKSNAFEMALEERNEHCADAKEKARTLELENAQLRKELEGAKRQAQVSDTERRAFISELESVQQGLINDRDHFRTLAQTNWKMAEELAVDLKDTHDETGCFFSDCSTLLLLSRFQTLKQQQPK